MDDSLYIVGFVTGVGGMLVGQNAGLITGTQALVVSLVLLAIGFVAVGAWLVGELWPVVSGSGGTAVEPEADS